MIASRQLGFAALAALAALAAGCSTRGLHVGVTDVPPDGMPADAGPPPPAVDILFVVDDSSLTRRLQQNLVRHFPLLMAQLMHPSGLANLHVAVISTDLGAGNGSITGCNATGGKNGAFQFRPRGSCTETGLDAGATFISDVGGARNYSGNIQEVFGCIAPLGETGCGFEHQLAAITRALGADGRPPPPENEGFLRPDATLVIVVVTDEDDCSAAPGSALFDTRDTSLDSDLGPAASFRCNEFGHLCNGARPPRQPPDGDPNQVVTLDGCVPAEDQGLLIPIATLAEQVRSLKRHPEQIVVAAVTGPSTPYEVRWTTGTRGLRPQIGASCTATDTSTAAPAVRIERWVRAFGDHGMMLPVCADSYGAAFVRLAELMSGAPPVLKP